MYNYYFDDDITKKAIVNLVNDIQDKDEITLHFQTYGGDTVVMEYLISVLNSLGDKITVNIIYCLCSAGTLLLVNYKGKLTIDPNIEFMLFHKIDREIYTLRKQDIDTKKLLKIMEKDNKILAEKYKSKGILNEKQVKIFNRGKDIILYRDDILKIRQLICKSLS